MSQGLSHGTSRRPAQSYQNRQFLMAFSMLARGQTAIAPGDSHSDNTIIADLPRPVAAAGKPSGRGQRYPPGVGQFGIGHAAGAVADRKRDVRYHRAPFPAA